MKDWLDKFLSEFHSKYLKKLGYKKNRRTFSREMETYWERFHFQGSMSNGLNLDWQFYVNIGVEFKNLEPRKNWSHFANTHWAGRLNQLASDAPSVWNYNLNTNQEDLISKLLTLMNSASENLKAEIDSIRFSYIKKKGDYVQ